jgi:hypothetical protein
MTDDTNGQSRTVAILLTAGFLLMGVVGLGLTAAVLFDVETPVTDSDSQDRTPERNGGERAPARGPSEPEQADDGGTDRQNSRASDGQDEPDNSYQDGENTANDRTDEPADDTQEPNFDEGADGDQQPPPDSGRECTPDEAPRNLAAFLDEMEGSGLSNDPYEITTVCELQAMNADLDAAYLLGDDIDAFQTPEWNDGKGFTPIGATESFTGSLDGLFRAIGGLTINRSGDAGLFASVGATAEIERLDLVAADVRGADRVGALAGAVDTQVDVTTVSVDGTIRGDDRVGGVVGVNDGVLTDVTSDVSIEANETAGGLAGTNGENGIIDGGTAETALDATVNLTASAETTGLGGLVGVNQGTVTGGTVTATMTVTSAGGPDPDSRPRSGGVVGVSTDSGEITDTVGETVLITGTENARDVAGFVGANRGTIRQSETAGTVTGTAGFAVTNSGVIEDSTTTAAVTGSAGFVESNSGTILESTATGDVDNVDSPTSAGGFVQVNSGTIVASTATGNVNSSTNAGGFASSNGGRISESTATGDVDASDKAGGFLVLNIQALVNDSAATGDVETGPDSVETGGFAARNTGTLQNITARGDVTGSESVGGAVGHNRDALQRATATGDVSGHTRVGGLVGDNQANVTDSTATGNVSGVETVGGAIGLHRNIGDDPIVADTTATGTLTVGTDRQGSDDASQFGGFVGVNEAVITTSIAAGAVNPSDDSLATAGGFAGENEGRLTETQASGNVTADETAGGLAAVNTGRIVHSAATGAADGGEAAGGLLGRNGGSVSNTFAAGTVSSASVAGGLVGSQEQTGGVERSYWDVERTGQQASTGASPNTTDVEGLDTEQMQGEAAIQNMDDLDFEDVWTTTDDYPRLRDAGAN